MKLALPTLETVKLAGATPEYLVGDRGYDSNALRRALLRKGIRPVFPARSCSKHALCQDGRGLRRYNKRWIVERTNAWLQNFRRLVVRYEHSAEIFTALVYMACAMILIRKVSG